jgi:predicted RNA binding protein YcfA (HicA-like mRNA interferase family)
LKQGKVPKLRIYSKELPLLNPNGYQLLRSFGTHYFFGTKDKEKVNLLLTKAERTV